MKDSDKNTIGVVGSAYPDNRRMRRLSLAKSEVALIHRVRRLQNDVARLEAEWLTAMGEADDGLV